MTIYYKATRLDGTDFRTGTVDYASAAVTGKRVRVTTPTQASYECCTDGVLHASDVPDETLTGGSWPCRLFEVTGRPVASNSHKRGFRSLHVRREIGAWQALGPNGREVAAMISRAGRLTKDEAHRLGAARSAVGNAVWNAAWHAAWHAGRFTAGNAAQVAARDAVRSAARDAARHAARFAAARAAAWDATRNAAWDAGNAVGDAAAALVVRDLITPEQYQLLAGPWESVIGGAA